MEQIAFVEWRTVQPSRRWPNSSACPVCGIADGIPRTVTAQRGTYLVTLSCDKCGHKWVTERKPDTQLFQPWHYKQLHTP